MKVKTAIIGLIALVVLAGIFVVFLGSEDVRVPDPFGDSRQKMANELTACKTAANGGDWTGAKSHLDLAKAVWNGEVKSTFSQDEKFKDRTSTVEKYLTYLTSDVSSKNAGNLNYNANQTIWAISAQPEGFKVAAAQYTVWDWVFAMAIGIGFNIGVIAAAMYLRKTYKGGE
ncbi:MAG: hypothetical protein PHH26_00940 [Candidatus Thermoplasmatota archaeon]|nr:hypothetical protein [Candidatus Thermoplasmatota archaeon]